MFPGKELQDLDRITDYPFHVVDHPTVWIPLGRDESLPARFRCQFVSGILSIDAR